LQIKRVDFYEQLLNAQREKSLIVFAGAGVSMGPPSNYPSFDGLVDEIARWADKKRPEREPPERFLGRLVYEKQNVHEQVVNLLSSPDSKHNPLHEDLLKLFVGRSRYAADNSQQAPSVMINICDLVTFL